MPNILEIIRGYDGSEQKAEEYAKRLEEACLESQEEGQSVEAFSKKLAHGLEGVTKEDFLLLKKIIDLGHVEIDSPVRKLGHVVREKSGVAKLGEAKKAKSAAVDEAHESLEAATNSYIEKLEAARKKLGKRKETTSRMMGGRLGSVVRVPGNAEVYDALVANLKAARKLKACFGDKVGKTEEDKTVEILKFSAVMRTIDTSKFTPRVKGWKEFSKLAAGPVGVILGTSNKAEKIARAELYRIQEEVINAKRVLYQGIGELETTGSKWIEVTKTDKLILQEMRAVQKGTKSTFDGLVQVVAIARVAANHDHEGRDYKTQDDYVSYGLLKGSHIFDASQVEGEEAKAELRRRAIEFDQAVSNACEVREKERSSKRTEAEILYDRFAKGIELERKYLTDIGKNLKALSDMGAELEAKGRPFDRQGLDFLMHTYERMINAVSSEELEYYKKHFFKVLHVVCSPEGAIEESVRKKLIALGNSIERDITQYCKTHFELITGLDDKKKALYLEMLVKAGATIFGAEVMAGNVSSHFGGDHLSHHVTQELDLKLEEAAFGVAEHKLDTVGHRLQQPPRSDAERVIQASRRIQAGVKSNAIPIGLGVATVVSLFVFPPAAPYLGAAGMAHSAARTLKKSASLANIEEDMKKRKKDHNKEYMKYLQEVEYPRLREKRESDPAAYNRLRGYLLRDAEQKKAKAALLSQMEGRVSRPRPRPVELKVVTPTRPVTPVVPDSSDVRSRVVTPVVSSSVTPMVPTTFLEAERKKKDEEKPRKQLLRVVDKLAKEFDTYKNNVFERFSAHPSDLSRDKYNAAVELWAGLLEIRGQLLEGDIEDEQEVAKAVAYYCLLAEKEHGDALGKTLGGSLLWSGTFKTYLDNAKAVIHKHYPDVMKEAEMLAEGAYKSTHSIRKVG